MTLSQKIDDMLNRDYGHLLKHNNNNNSNSHNSNNNKSTENDYLEATYGDPKLQQEIQEKIYRLRLSHMESFHVDQLMSHDELREQWEKQQSSNNNGSSTGGIAPKRTSSAYAQLIKQRSREEVRERQRRAARDERERNDNSKPRHYVKLVSR